MTTVEVRMYHVGFGDAFRVTVRDGRDTWRMLVDCGVHPQGQARSISESVKNIITDLVGDCGDAPAHLDVVVATHHHQDHISGFAEDDWSEVQVDQVWVPFVEDLEDADGKALRRAQTLTAQKLDALITARQSLAASDTNAAAVLAAAKAFAVNSSGNAVATNRLLSRDGVQSRTDLRSGSFHTRTQRRTPSTPKNVVSECISWAHRGTPIYSRK